MKYTSPAIVNVRRATTVIKGAKDQMIQDSSNPNQVLSGAPGYPADE
jgi:hypothetical protein